MKTFRKIKLNHHSLYLAVFLYLTLTIVSDAQEVKKPSEAKQVTSGKPSSPEPTASPIDYTHYSKALKTYVNDQGLVNYREWKKNPRDLDLFLSQTRKIKQQEFEKWDKKDQIALLINIYNAQTIKAILGHYPIQASGLSAFRYPKNSIRQIDGVWTKIEFLMMGERLTLDKLEHQVLRKKYEEPRIHMAIVCAALGCPYLRNEPYEGHKLDAQLDDQSRRYLASERGLRIDRKKGKVYVSQIFKWFGDDFKQYGTKGFGGQKTKNLPVLNFIAKYASESNRKYLTTSKFSLDYIDYDWSLNEQ